MYRPATNTPSTTTSSITSLCRNVGQSFIALLLLSAGLLVSLVVVAYFVPECGRWLEWLLMAWPLSLT